MMLTSNSVFITKYPTMDTCLIADKLRKEVRQHIVQIAICLYLKFESVSTRIKFESRDPD